VDELSKEVDELSKEAAAARGRKPWQPPVLKSVGTIEKILQGGAGKVSLTGGDSGDARKEVGNL
jgi:hypothetical protein